MQSSAHFPTSAMAMAGRQQALRSRHGRGASGHLASAGSTGIPFFCRSSSPSDSYELPARGWPCQVAKDPMSSVSSVILDPKNGSDLDQPQTCAPLRPPRTALASWSKERSSDENMAKTCCWGEILITFHIFPLVSWKMYHQYPIFHPIFSFSVSHLIPFGT